MFLCISCKKDEEEEVIVICEDPTNPDCPNFDPCISSSQTSAQFEILIPASAGLPYADSLFADTATRGGSIVFRAEDTAANYYKWYLGTEVIEGAEIFEVSRVVDQDLPNGTYTAALSIQDSPDTACFPEDTGLDSVFRYFTKVDLCDFAIVNKFRGTYEDKPDELVEIEIIDWKPSRDEYCVYGSYLHAINFDGNNDTIGIAFDIVGIGNSILIASTPPFGGLRGKFEVDVTKGELTAVYSFYSDSTYRKFRGWIK